MNNWDDMVTTTKLRQFLRSALSAASIASQKGELDEIGDKSMIQDYFFEASERNSEQWRDIYRYSDAILRWGNHGAAF
jgi:hypothetical protein